ncbi:MAG TPA: hypothetical protein VFE18_18725 [Phenylobacterium sp.]|uniref:hypothetical protein n=1 Tax=Phenylobacterium sp. TaxID=1871053 RepID=UPI002D71BD65|nr:hypothetical protein [Phenylobacterium sp.]HZZ70213.1 hypothetical protein [Phenylobacterium sp.]
MLKSKLGKIVSNTRMQDVVGTEFANEKVLSRYTEGPVIVGRYQIGRVWTEGDEDDGEYHAHHYVRDGDEEMVFQDFPPFGAWLHETANLTETTAFQRIEVEREGAHRRQLAEELADHRLRLEAEAAEHKRELDRRAVAAKDEATRAQAVKDAAQAAHDRRMQALQIATAIVCVMGALYLIIVGFDRANPAKIVDELVKGVVLAAAGLIFPKGIFKRARPEKGP